MENARVYADLQKTDDQGHLILTCQGTQQDLHKLGIVLRENLLLHFWRDDADENGNSDPLYFEGMVHYNPILKHWVTAIDWDNIRNASEEQVDAEKMEPILR